jgi:drug/metabolite transporter (DMT)-like permease
MNFPWFKRTGIFFVPASVAGWLILVAGLAFAVYSFMDIDSRSHSSSDTLMNFAFMLLIIGAVYSLIAYATSRVIKK